MRGVRRSPIDTSGITRHPAPSEVNDSRYDRSRTREVPIYEVFTLETERFLGQTLLEK